MTRSAHPKIQRLIDILRGAPARLIGLMRSLSVYQMFRDDKLLLAAYLVLCASALAPIVVTPILPLVDMGSNIGAAGLLDDAAFGKGVVAQHYFLNPRLVPYWTVYLFMGAVESVAGPFISAKLTVAIAVVLWPLSVMRLLRAFGRDPRLGLWAFILTWDVNLYWGWITFQIGMALALWTIAKIFETQSLRDALRVLPLTVLIALTHVHAVALLLVVGGLLTFIKRPLWRAFLTHSAALVGCALTIAPWLWSKLFSGPRALAHGPFGYATHPPEQKLGSLFHYTLDIIPSKEPGVTTYAFLLLLIGPTIFLLQRPRGTTQLQRQAPALFLLGAAGLYWILPFELWGPITHWWTYPRYGTYVLVGLLLLPRPQLQRLNALWLTPGVVCAFLVHRAVQTQFQKYGQYVSPYLEIVAALPHNSLFFPLDLDIYRFDGTTEPVLGQLHGYAAAATSSYDPHLFDDPNTPLRFRAENQLPAFNWRDPHSFTMQTQGKYYDYIIVQPSDRDPLHRVGEAVRLVKQAGPWRLYQVKH